jgi:hypothetical protein
MMQLSLSYKEYEQWAAEVRTLAPESDVLRRQLPFVLRAKELGKPWAEILKSFAANHISDKLKVGNYSEAASTYQIMLANRKELDLNTDDWKFTVLQLGTLRMELVERHRKQARALDPNTSADEFNSLLSEARIYFKDFLAQYPSDKYVSEDLDLLERRVQRYSIMAQGSGSSKQQVLLLVLAALLAILPVPEALTDTLRIDIERNQRVVALCRRGAGAGRNFERAA